MKRLVLTLALLAIFNLGGMAQLYFGFEYGIQGWTTIDGDGDGRDWQLVSTGGNGHLGSDGMLLSYSVDPDTGNSLSPNDYLVSPPIMLYENGAWVIRFWGRALDPDYPSEHVGIAVSTTVNDDINAFSLIQEWTLDNHDWYNYSCDLAQFNGQKIYIAITHHDSNGNSALCIDDVNIWGDIIVAQDDFWKLFNLPSNFYPFFDSIPALAAVAQNGDLFAYGEEGMYRSQDEGETWENVLYFEPFLFQYPDVSTIIGQEGRIFVAPMNDEFIYYSDNGGDTWLEFSSFYLYHDENIGLCSPSNDILLYWNDYMSGTYYSDDNYLYYTLDNGNTWDGANMSFITGNVGISDVIANETGDVYVSVYSDIPQPASTPLGVYHSTLSDMGYWELVAFEGIGVKDMEFDPEGNVLCAVDFGGSFSGYEHVPGFYAYSAPNVCVSDNGIIYKLVIDVENYRTILAYSLDHGEHFYNTGQTFFLYVPYYVKPGLIKGRDNHLYFYDDTSAYQYWKSIFNANDIPYGSAGLTEWYYEIENENGTITYQYLYQAGDTIIQDEPTHILVKINTLYDKDVHTDVTHEYVYERDGKLYWWNKTLEEFTVLYDFGAQEGDTWVTKVGTETLIMHVDAVEDIEYEGRTWRMLRVSDANDLFSGDIVCGIGHLTSFFPERLMDNGDGVRVEGLRCYWIDDELVFKLGDEDCDAIYSEVHGVEEDGPSTPSTGLVVYPNPTDGVLFVQTLRATSLPNLTYCITNLMGQIVLSGNITAETQQIDASDLPKGMYFISIGGETRKFVVR